MSPQNKKILLVTLSVVTVVGLGYLAYRQWGSANPLFGPGKVDGQAKRNRTFRIAR